MKSRHSIKFIKVSGERSAADRVGAENWIKNVLPGLTEGYDLNDIFNVDETGLFYKAAPSGTLAVAGSDPTGGRSNDCPSFVQFYGNRKEDLRNWKIQKSALFQENSTPVAVLQQRERLDLVGYFAKIRSRIEQSKNPSFRRQCLLS